LRPTVSLVLGFWIKDALELFEADVGISISRFRARILLSRGRKSSLVALMSGGGPDDHRMQIPTISTDAFNGSYSCTLNSCTSILLPIILTDKDFDRAKHG
jgi:hypothetical protein